MSHLFAYLSRMKFIRRWGLMHNTYPENVQEHSLRVAQIAHALAIIRNRRCGGAVSPERAATLALYHDASEVLTGDLPTPIKYHNATIRRAYKEIEASAAERLLAMVPEEMRPDYHALLVPGDEDGELRELVEAADKICAYLKCLEERAGGNREFATAEVALRQKIEALGLPEVQYFLATFAPSFGLSLDDLSE